MASSPPPSLIRTWRFPVCAFLVAMGLGFGYRWATLAYSTPRPVRCSLECHCGLRPGIRLPTPAEIDAKVRPPVNLPAPAQEGGE